MPDDLDAELLRIGLWTVFAAASLARPGEATDALGMPYGRDARAAAEADYLLDAACRRWPDLAEPVT